MLKRVLFGLLLVIGLSSGALCAKRTTPDSVLWIAQAEANKTHPPKVNSAQPSKKVIVLDAGHGGDDEGAKVDALLEKRVTLTTALLTKRYLEMMGYRVVLTRNKDVFMSLAQRVMVTSRFEDAVFVSIHYNSCPSSDVSGVEIFYHEGGDGKKNRQSRRLAQCVLNDLLENTMAPSRGIKINRFYVLRENTVPAILIEAGFMTNREERAKLKTKVYLEKIAEGIAKGIGKYLET